jgi:hypothetical protein
MPPTMGVTFAKVPLKTASTSGFVSGGLKLKVCSIQALTSLLKNTLVRWISRHSLVRFSKPANVQDPVRDDSRFLHRDLVCHG